MAERVVHVLEIVDVEIEHGEGRRPAQAAVKAMVSRLVKARRLARLVKLSV